MRKTTFVIFVFAGQKPSSAGCTASDARAAGVLVPLDVGIEGSSRERWKHQSYSTQKEILRRGKTPRTVGSAVPGCYATLTPDAAFRTAATYFGQPSLHQL